MEKEKKRFTVIQSDGTHKTIISQKTAEELREYITKYDIFVSGRNVFPCESIKEIIEKDKK